MKYWKAFIITVKDFNIHHASAALDETNNLRKSTFIYRHIFYNIQILLLTNVSLTKILNI